MFTEVIGALAPNLSNLPIFYLTLDLTLSRHPHLLDMYLVNSPKYILL
jgi:hypothetical protein